MKIQRSIFRAPQNVPFEVWLKLAASGIGIFGEYYTALDEKWQFEERHNLQHIMMYAFFAIHPIMELLYYFKLDNIPPKLDYLGAILAGTSNTGFSTQTMGLGRRGPGQ